MAIVDGKYVSEEIGSTKDLQNQYFGSYTKKDMVDYTQAALQIKLKELENQFNLDVWNMQNEYNTPAAQMLRFQDAGLNPNLIYGQSNMAGDVKSATAAQPRSAGTFGKMTQAGISAISQMISAARSAREMYDYLNYGKDLSRYQTQTAFFNSAYARERADQASLDTQFLNYISGRGLNVPIEYSSDLSSDEVWRKSFENSPRAKLYDYQVQTQEQKFNQLVQLVAMIPNQSARLAVLKQLDDYRLEIMKGQNDFVLNVHTGLGEGFDNFIKMMMFITMSRLQ